MSASKRAKSRSLTKLAPDFRDRCVRCAVPGASAVRVKKSRVGTIHTAGLASATTNAPVQTDTVFQAASLSKPVFAAVVIRMALQGGIDLDRPLVSYGVKMPFADARLEQLTSNQVLRHTSGLPNWIHGDGDRRLLCDPDTKFTYSGLGYQLLQEAVQIVVGQPLEAWIASELLLPLGMTNSSFVRSARLTERLAQAHNVTGQPTTAIEFVQANAASSLITTAPDYARFVRHVIADDELMQATLYELTDAGDGIAWGLGWGVEHCPRGPVLFHWGDNPGFTCFVLVELSVGKAIVVLTNGQNGRAAYSPLVRHWFGEDLQCLSWLASRYR